MKPKLLILELWGVGDLVIATPFIQAAAERFDITLLAKPFALDLQPEFWPGVTVIPFDAPWTVFRNKYHLWRWPLAKLGRLQAHLARENFAAAVSARWDPRDHVLLKLTGAGQTLGFPRAGSRHLLTHPLARPAATAHRYEFWCNLAVQLGFTLPAREELPSTPRTERGQLIVHTGARLPARIWPLENYRQLIDRLRATGRQVTVVADENQEAWWREAGETPVVPHSIADLCSCLEEGAAFIGNCSGPGHLAAILGLPTFTIFGASLPEWFLPLHPQAEYVEGPACPYRPCSDYCHFSEPRCLTGLGVETVWNRLQPFLAKHAPAAQPRQLLCT